MICASGGDASAATCVAVAGVGPSRVWPSTVTPAFSSDARSAPVVNSAGLSATSEYFNGPERAPIDPRTAIAPSERRDALIRPPDPLVRLTDASIGIVVVAGSRVTTALLPSGFTTTQTRFSLSDSADTRAA
jgi:hypothetical protein